MKRLRETFAGKRDLLPLYQTKIQYILNIIIYSFKKSMVTIPLISINKSAVSTLGFLKS
jgi:hypothetical protein